MKRQEIGSKTKKKRLGKIYPPDTYVFMLVVHRKHKDEKSGITYQVATSANCGYPIVTSDKTSNIFTLSWKEIIKLAVAAGINRPCKTKGYFD